LTSAGTIGNQNAVVLGSAVNVLIPNVTSSLPNNCGAWTYSINILDSNSVSYATNPTTLTSPFTWDGANAKIIINSLSETDASNSPFIVTVDIY